MAHQRGLEWIQEPFLLRPEWTEEPNISVIESIVRKTLNLMDDGECEVHFHAQGAYNKTYRVTTASDKYIMRVALPVDPVHKTTSEVATMAFVREHTNMPVPKVFAYNTSNENELGFEWILMEFMAGLPLRTKWRNFSMDIKADIVKTLACYQAQLFEKMFDAIGNLYWSEAGDPGSEGADAVYSVGRIVSQDFFLGDHISKDVPRGRFKKSTEWLRARLSFLLMDQERILTTSEDEDEIEDAQGVKEASLELLRILPDIFRGINAETTILSHDDMSMENVLVDEQGVITAVIDWECVSTVPLWRACQIPALLEGPNRIEEPCRNNYAKAEPEGRGADLGNEGISSLYWEHLLDHECTLLRQVFIEEMARLQPRWIEAMRSEPLKADLDFAVSQVDGLGLRMIKRWVSDYKSGQHWSLRERMVQ